MAVGERHASPRANAGRGACEAIEGQATFSGDEQFSKLQKLLKAEQKAAKAGQDEEFDDISDEVTTYWDEIERNDMTTIKVGSIVTVESYYGDYVKHIISELKPLPM